MAVRIVAAQPLRVGDRVVPTGYVFSDEELKGRNVSAMKRRDEVIVTEVEEDAPKASRRSRSHE